jgi:hypothetical protein
MEWHVKFDGITADVRDHMTGMCSTRRPTRGNAFMVDFEFIKFLVDF